MTMGTLRRIAASIVLKVVRFHSRQLSAKPPAPQTTSRSALSIASRKATTPAFGYSARPLFRAVSRTMRIAEEGGSSRRSPCSVGFSGRFVLLRQHTRNNETVNNRVELRHRNMNQIADLDQVACSIRIRD